MSAFALAVFAALVAPLMITGGLVVWDALWTGHPVNLNLFKCAVATVMFFITATGIGIARTTSGGTSSVDHEGYFYGSGDYDMTEVYVLIVSGILGITIGDNFWLSAVQLIGARRVVLVDSLKPFLAMWFGYVWLGEKIESWTFSVGLLLVTFGVVITAREGVGGDKPAGDAAEGEVADKTPSARISISPSAASANRVCMEDHHVDTSVNVNAKVRKVEQETQVVEGAHANSSSTIATTATIHDPAPPLKLELDDIALEQEQTAPVVAPEEAPGAKPVQRTPVSRSQLGYSAAVLNVIFDVGAAVMAKKYCRHWSALDVNWIRFGTTAVLLGLVTAGARRYFRSNNGLSTATLGGGAGRKLCKPEEEDASWHQFPSLRRKHWLHVTAAVFFVTFLGPTFATIALFELPVALVITLTSIGPLYALPAVYFLKGEKITCVGIAGAFAVVAGVAVLTLL